MKQEMTTVLQVCAFGADCPGNFIASLVELERALAQRGIRTIYAFVERARDKSWCRELAKRTRVYFLPEAKARILPETYRVFGKIYKENQVDVVHTHFELYDIPATVMAPGNTKVFWHLHDPLDFGKGMRRILWKIQYGMVGKRATLLSVADRYRDLVVGQDFPEKQTRIILNGIDLKRVCTDNCPKKEYEFIAFGWDFERKGVDLILDACRILWQEGRMFRMMMNGGSDMKDRILDHLKCSVLPEGFMVGEPIDNVAELYGSAKAFISASRRETFSYAVCEAAYAGLPVISSDIAGLEWAHELPAVSFFESENAEALAACMRVSLDGGTYTEAELRATRNRIEQEYSIRAWVEKILNEYGLC